MHLQQQSQQRHSASPAWYPPLCQANKDTLQKLQNRSLRIITGCTETTPIYHLHNETKILTVQQHLKMIGTQFFSLTLIPNHPNHHRQPPQRNKKMTPALLYSNIFNTIPPPPPTTNLTKHIYTTLTHRYLNSRQRNPILINTLPHKDNSDINSEMTLSQKILMTLAQLQLGHCHLLQSFKFKINRVPSPTCT